MVTEADRLREAAGEILAGSQFQPPGNSFFGRVGDWISDRISDLSAPLAGNNWFSVLSMLFAIGAIAWVLRRATRHRRAGRAQAAPTAGRMVRGPSAAERWRQLADEARAGGRWDEALRCEHRYVVARLDDRALLVERDHRTAGELLADVQVHREVHAGLGDITSAFETAWYGGESVDPARVESVRHVGDTVIEAGGEV